MTETHAHLFFSLLDGIGPLHFNLMVEYFGSARKSFDVSQKQLERLGIRSVKAGHIIQRRNSFVIDEEVKRLEKNAIWYIARSDDEYPKRLKNLPDAPIGLFGKGERSRFVEFLKNPCIGVVGSRKMTGYGKRVTQLLVSDLVSYNISIISGMMYGVDEAAHRETLNAGGNTIGVWAGGIDTVFAGSRLSLARLIEKSGVIISEFPLGLTPSKGTFPARNRIVSGLSAGVVVVEGARDSGSLITARLAAEQNREVFAVPGPITSEQSLGPLSLIKKGAKQVISVDDILEELPIAGRIKKGSPADRYTPQNKDEEAILALLKNEPHQIDELIRKSKLPGPRVSTILSILELAGVISRESDGGYVINR